jgi:hypothetical protein
MTSRRSPRVKRLHDWAAKENEKGRRQRILAIRRDCCPLINHGRGQWSVKLTIDHQAFPVSYGDHHFPNRHTAWHFATNLAIALNRFKFGD